MKKILTIVIILMLLGIEINAQNNFRFGITGGMNVSNFRFKPASIYNYNSKAGIMIGVVGDYSLSSCITLESNLLLSQKGYNYKIENTSIDVNLYYVELPVMIKYNYLRSESIGLDLSAGFYGALKVAENFSSDTYKINQGKIFSVPDFGLVIGTGVSLNENSIKLNLQYRVGLANIYNTSLFPDRNYEKDIVNNRNFTISLAYYFN
jgi:hypothetical protein